MDRQVPVFGEIPLIGGLFNLAGKIPIVGELVHFTGSLAKVPVDFVRNTVGTGIDAVTTGAGWAPTAAKLGLVAGLVKGGIEGWQRSENGEDVNFISSAIGEAARLGLSAGVLGFGAGATVGLARGVINTGSSVVEDTGAVVSELMPNSPPQTPIDPNRTLVQASPSLRA